MTLFELLMLLCQQGDLLVDVHIFAVDALELLRVLVGQDLVFLHETVLEAADDLLHLDRVLVLLLYEPARRLHVTLAHAQLGLYLLHVAFDFHLQVGDHGVQLPNLRVLKAKKGLVSSTTLFCLNLHGRRGA